MQVRTADAELDANSQRGREIASEQCEEAGDRNADAGVYFLNGRSSLRMIAARKSRRWESVAHRGDRKCGLQGDSEAKSKRADEIIRHEGIQVRSQKNHFG